MAAILQQTNEPGQGACLPLFWLQIHKQFLEVSVPRAELGRQDHLPPVLNLSGKHWVNPLMPQRIWLSHAGAFDPLDLYKR